MKNNVELLAPAGDFEKLMTALHFGADAVYVAGKKFGLRAACDNFGEAEMKKACGTVHAAGKKLYATLNIFARNADFPEIAEYAEFLEEAGVDGVIVSDFGVFSEVKRRTNLRLHVSTQANVTNKYAAKFWAGEGAERIVLARELALSEIAGIREFLPDEIRLEAFVHGAMCVSYSGRCLLSDLFTGRGANRGECVQACRWKYDVKALDADNIADAESDGASTGESVSARIEKGKLVDSEVEVRNGRPAQGGESYSREYEVKPIGAADGIITGEDGQGTYFLNGKDLCMIEHLGELYRAGVDSFKIEGRMKTAYYVATVVNAYRKAVDLSGEKDYNVLKELARETEKTSHRKFTTGFYFRKEEEKVGEICAESSKTESEYEFIAKVLGYDKEKRRIIIEQRNRFFEGDELELLSPREGLFGRLLKVSDLRDGEGNPVSDAKAVQQILSFETDAEAEELDVLRKKRSN